MFVCAIYCNPECKSLNVTDVNGNGTVVTIEFTVTSLAYDNGGVSATVTVS